MNYSIRYFVEYASTVEDDEKEVTVIHTEEFPSILSAVKWARILPSRCNIVNKYRVETGPFNVFENSEFDVALERPRYV